MTTESAVLIFCVMVSLPFLTFFCVKFGVVGYERGRDLIEVLKKEKKRDDERT